MSKVIYYNGDVYTFDGDDNVYEAIAVEGEKIVGVGSNADVLAYQTEQTEIINLQGKTVLPGFIDAHLHIFPLGFNLSYVDCRLQSVEAVVKAIKNRAKELNNEEEWIIGWGFDESLFEENRILNKWDFDEVNNPIYITRYCLHEAVANETAIQKAGITKETEVKNGIIERNGAGEATGLVKEKAMQLLEDVLPPYTSEKMKEALKLANHHLLENGITTAHDAGLGFFVDPYKEFDVLREMCVTGQLNIKMYVMILAEHFKDFLEENKDLELDMLKFGSMKLFSDGTLSGRTAAVEKPYRQSEERGMMLWTDAEMQEHVEVAHRMDKQVAIHAIGNRAVDQVLRIYELVQKAYPRVDIRHRIEHATLTNKNLIERMKNINVVPIPQPTLIHTAGDVHHAVVDTDGLDYFAFKTFMDAGLKPAGSSDSPITDCSPILGIYAAMTRKTTNHNVWNENERLSLKEAIKMYTIHAAYAAFEEEMKGSIEINKYADLVVLSNDFMNLSAEEVKATKIQMTIINGKIVYEK